MAMKRELILSYNHFERVVFGIKYNLDHIADEKERKAFYSMTRDYRKAIRKEPLELIAYVVRNNKPFTEIMTADYIMVAPLRGATVYFLQIKNRFKDLEDPFEYVPAASGITGKKQQSRKCSIGAGIENWLYPHAGLLSTFHYLRRYPTTDTNRNRLRARIPLTFPWSRRNGASRTSNRCCRSMPYKPRGWKRPIVWFAIDPWTSSRDYFKISTTSRDISAS